MNSIVSNLVFIFLIEVSNSSLVGFVVNDEFKGLSLRVSLLRTIMRYIGFYFMFIGLIIAVLNSQNKALHDIIADTIVIKAK